MLYSTFGKCRLSACLGKCRQFHTYTNSAHCMPYILHAIYCSNSKSSMLIWHSKHSQLTRQFCHYLLTLMSFQTQRLFFLRRKVWTFCLKSPFMFCGRNKVGFRVTWGWVSDDRIYIYGDQLFNNLPSAQ